MAWYAFAVCMALMCRHLLIALGRSSPINACTLERLIVFVAREINCICCSIVVYFVIFIYLTIDCNFLLYAHRSQFWELSTIQRYTLSTINIQFLYKWCNWGNLLYLAAFLTTNLLNTRGCLYCLTYLYLLLSKFLAFRGR